LQAICDFLDRQPALIEQVRRDLVRGLKKPNQGRSTRSSGGFRLRQTFS
jgi:hypothetical protein